MSLRLPALLAALAASGCAARSFIDDMAFLKRHTEVVVLADRTGDGLVAICPLLQGRVMTSTATGRGGVSYGWINRELIASGETKPHINAYGGEDRFWMGPEGGQFSVFFRKGDPFDLEHWQTPAPIDSEPFSLAKVDRFSALLRKKMRLVNASGAAFELEVQREIRVLDDGEPGKLLGIAPPFGVRTIAFESRNRVSNIGSEDWKKETGLLSAWILGMFNPSPGTTVAIPYKEGPAEKLGPIVNDAYFGKVPADRLLVEKGILYFRGDGLHRSKIGLSPRRSLGVLGSYDPANGVLTIVQFNQPKDVVDYVNSMWERQKEPYAGDAANSYNDGPAAPGKDSLGSFYELESSSPALPLRPGQNYLHIHRTFHFEGPADELDVIAKRVLGVGIQAIESAFAAYRTE